MLLRAHKFFYLHHFILFCSIRLAQPLTLQRTTPCSTHNYFKLLTRQSDCNFTKLLIIYGNLLTIKSSHANFNKPDEEINNNGVLSWEEIKPNLLIDQRDCFNLI